MTCPDTDWHVAELYAFAGDLGASVLVAEYSRYVVDLNRSSDDAPLYPGQVATGLCPGRTFAGEPIYRDGGVDTAERERRIERYWRPYHDRLRAILDTLRERFGHALLWDAHSIPARVPRLFDGELPDLNLGSNDSASCGAGLSAAVAAVADASDYRTVVDGRFKGGYITRHYGRPDGGVHALQLEIAQRAYMDEARRELLPAKVEALRATLRHMLDAFLDSARR